MQHSGRELNTSVAEFERLVRIGLGRAILVLQQADPHPYREAILHACLHDLTFDSQIEGSRAEYVFDMVKLSGDAKGLRQAILARLQDHTDYWDAEQLVELALRFAQQGDEEARSAIYARFSSLSNIDSPNPDSFGTIDEVSVGAEEIVRLDGAKGLVFVAEHLGERALVDEDFWYDSYLIDLARERVGAGVVDAELGRARQESPKVAAFLDNVEKWVAENEADKGARRVDYSEWSYEYLKSLLGSSGTEHFGFMSPTSWGRVADEASLERAARDLCSEDDPKRLVDYLRIFGKREFPLGPEPLMAHARSRDDDIARAAFIALHNIRHPSVRSLAIPFMALPKRAHMAVGLFEKNYEPGDHLIIEQALHMEQEEWQFHWVGHGALAVFEANPLFEAVDALLRIYEKGPCSQCRGRCFDLLQVLGKLPAWMVQECLYDSNQDLRDKASALETV